MRMCAPTMHYVSGPVPHCQAGLRRFGGVFHQALDVAHRRVSDGFISIVVRTATICMNVL